jgi:hypothetical protein
MSLDIKEGDVLVVGANEYPIRSCAEWSWRYSRTFRRMATVTASTKRNPALVSGKRGAPVANLTGVKCTPLDPVDPELAVKLRSGRSDLGTPHELLVTFVDGGNVFYRLVLEDLKR